MDKLIVLYFLSTFVLFLLMFFAVAEVEAEDEATENLYLLLSMLLTAIPLSYMRITDVHSELVFHVFVCLYWFFLGRIVYRVLIRKL
jgi:predicted permease